MVTLFVGVAGGGSLTNTGCDRGWPRLRSVTSTTISWVRRETKLTLLHSGHGVILCLVSTTDTLLSRDGRVAVTVTKAGPPWPPLHRPNQHHNTVHCIIAGETAHRRRKVTSQSGSHGRFSGGRWRQIDQSETAAARGEQQVCCYGFILVVQWPAELLSQVETLEYVVRSHLLVVLCIKIVVRCEDACGSSHDTQHIRHCMTDIIR